MAVVIGFFVKFLFFNKGLVEEYNTTNVFLLVMILVCVPKLLFTIFSFIPKVGAYIGIAVAATIVCIVLWGITAGFCQFRIREVVYESPYVPKAFDGYRIVQISDAHTGSFRGPYKNLLAESLGEVNALKPDLICFVGDIENFTPAELTDHKAEYSQLKAKDGVIAVMGNHDYSSYVKVSPRERAAMVAETRQVQRDFGWDLLENESRVIRRDNGDSIVIVGEENWGMPPFPQYGNMKKATATLNINKEKHLADDGFVVMLSHDPNAWEEHVLPVIHPDITLSGHTHGTQMTFFGWSPASMMYKYWGGESFKRDKERNMMISVSTGIGGNFPFRFNLPREAVVITLKRSER